MKTLFNNKGISLVILIVAMTLIGVLGASFVSLMSSKQKGFLYQIDSYRALNLANAGVEYAVRCAGDRLTSPNTSDLSACLQVIGTMPNTNQLSDSNQWRSYIFGGGRFYLSYYLNPNDPDNFNTNKVLYSVGEYGPVGGETRRFLKIRTFLAYGSPSLTGSGRLILVPGKVPEPWGSRYVVIPLINVYDALITITSLTLTANSEKPLSRIYLSTTSGSPGTQIVYTSPSPYQTCNPTPCATPPCIDPPCRDTNNNLTIPTIPATWPASVDPIPCSGTCSIPGYSIRWIYFDFVTGTSLSDTYILTINFDAGAGSESTTITFTIP